MKRGTAITLPLPWGGGRDLLQVMRRPLTLLLTAASVTVVANALALAAPQAAGSEPDTRLGVSLQDGMAQRDRTLAAEKRRLDMREQAAKAGEARLAAEVTARQGAADSPIGGAPRRANEPNQPDQPYDDLARIYQAMKPARAAPIFEKLDLEVQTQVARRMRDRSTALLMAAMSPNAAAELTMSLAGRNVIPQRAKKTAAETPPPNRRRDQLAANTPPVAGK